MSVIRGDRVVLRSMGGDGELWVIACAQDGQEVGSLSYRAGHPADDWLTIESIELEKGYRGWGYGSEAARLLEEAALRGGRVSRFRVDVNVRNGLGLYFWLRLGYRPATPEEAFWRSDADGDIISMIRSEPGSSSEHAT